MATRFALFRNESRQGQSSVTADGKNFMKAILLLLTVLSLQSVFAQTSNGLLAEDLARHLAVKVWKTTLHLSPARYSVKLLKIKDGKIIETPITEWPEIGPDFGLTDRVSLVLMVSEDSTLKVRWSLFIGERGERNFDEALKVASTLPLPEEISEGDFILGGTYFRKASQPPEVRDFQQGTLLRISKNPNQALE